LAIIFNSLVKYINLLCGKGLRSYFSITDGTYAVSILAFPSAGPSTGSGEPQDRRQSSTLAFSVFVFALYERKNEKQNMSSTMLPQALGAVQASA
jgi:hypothetical protein